MLCNKKRTFFFSYYFKILTYSRSVSLKIKSWIRILKKLHGFHNPFKVTLFLNSDASMNNEHNPVSLPHVNPVLMRYICVQGCAQGCPRDPRLPQETFLVDYPPNSNQLEESLAFL